MTVAGVIAGEQVEIRVAAGGHHRSEAELVRVLRASPHRVEPGCRHAGECGGCAWQHIAYAEQLRLKQRRLQRMLSASLGGQAPRVESTIATMGLDADGEARRGDEIQTPWGFRQKVSFVFGPGSHGQSLVMGHYRRGSNTIVPVEECPVHAAAGNALAFRMRDALLAAGVPGAADAGRQGVARHVVVRSACNGSEVLATLVVTANDKALRGAVRRILDGPGAPDGLHLNIHDRPGPFLFGKATRRLHGRDRLREEVGSVSFLVSPTAFFQTNVRAAEALVRLVVDVVGDRPPRRVLDLYAGAGLFALPLARRGHHVTAVEENSDAVEDGKASRRFSRIADGACRFVQGRVEDVIRGGPRGAAAGPEADVVVLDPPRAGCPERVLDAIVGSVRPARIVYVSCGPEALARDLVVALAGGYRIDRVQPVDMFPHTAHIESVALLSLAP